MHRSLPPAGHQPGRRAGAHVTGLGLGVAAFVVWGVLPLYLRAVAPTGTFELVAWRIVLSLPFCLTVLLLAKRWDALVALVRDRRAMLWLGLASLAVLANWSLYVLSVELGRSLEGSLGYYLNPLMSMMAGMLVLRERLRPLQWLAAALAAAAFVVMVVAYGEPPWLSLGIAVTFALYGLLKKQLSGHVDPIAGLVVETGWLTPIGLATLAVLGFAGPGLTLGTVSAGHTALLLCAGAVTSIPLLLFAAATARLSLVDVGILQYIAPTMQFLLGVLVLHEPMPAQRLWGFALVWLALLVFTVDLVRVMQRRRRARRTPEAPEVGT